MIDEEPVLKVAREAFGENFTEAIPLCIGRTIDAALKEMVLQINGPRDSLSLHRDWFVNALKNAIRSAIAEHGDIARTAGWTILEAFERSLPIGESYRIIPSAPEVPHG